jgi:hypothetical protein
MIYTFKDHIFITFFTKTSISKTIDFLTDISMAYFHNGAYPPNKKKDAKNSFRIYFYQQKTRQFA